MRRDKRGFTLLEILIVMIISAAMLPVIGTAFYMLLSVPPRETGKLTTINDVATAVNWIRDDALRAQFYSGSPAWYQSVIRYTYDDLTPGEAGADLLAWEAHGSQTPGSPGTPADNQDYNDIAQDDDNRWETDLVPDTEENDGDWDTQMYQFTVYEEVDEIQRISIDWAGHGETQSGYWTYVMAWDFTANGGAGDWEHISGQNGLGPLDGSLGGGLDPLRHIDSATGAVFIQAAAEHYYDAGGNSCPFLFGWNGTGYEFIDVAFPDVFLKRYETTSYPSTGCLLPVEGYYDLVIQQSLPETGYINNLAIWAVDHPEGTEVMMEQSMVMAPERSGTIHTVRHPQPVTAVDRDGRDVTALLADRDGDYWVSDLEGKDFSDVNNLMDWVTITLPQGPAEGSAKLVIDAGESMLGKFQLWYCSQYLLGTPNLDYFLNRLETDEDFYRYFDLTVWLSSAFTVQYWDGSEWVDYVDIGFVDFMGRPQVVDIDLGRIQGSQLRLHTPVGLREIDYVAVDYTPDAEVVVTELEAAEVIQHFEDGSEADVLDAIAAADDSYLVIEQGDYVSCRFAVPPEPPAEGFQRSFVIPTGGYYYVRGPEVPFDWIHKLSLAEELTYVPYAYSKWTLPRYVNPEGYDWWQYYPMSYDHSTPVFPDEGDNTLYSDFIVLTVIIPKEVEGEAAKVKNYGSFSWVDRTGSESHSYTVHYNYVDGRMMREEWVDNELVSEVAVAKNIRKFEDVTFVYFPRGDPGSAISLPYLRIDAKSSAGAGAYKQVAETVDYITIRGQGVSEGFAVLTKDTEGYPTWIEGSGLQIDGDIYSFRGVHIEGDNAVIGTVEAAGQIDDPGGILMSKIRFSQRQDKGWGLQMSDFIKDPADPKEREYIYSGSGWWDLGACAACWEADGTTLKTGVYYNPNGSILLQRDGVRGVFTLIGDRVVIDADDTRFLALSNGVLAYATGERGIDDDTILFPVTAYNATWTGTLFAPDGTVNVSGAHFSLFGAVAGQAFHHKGERTVEDDYSLIFF